MTLAGTVLQSRYRLLDVVGEGGMAVVYRARDELLDRDVAVKILRPQFAADDEFVRRFRQEARSAASLAHPNIAPVFDSGVHGELQFIVMQLVEGPDLEKILNERGRLPVPEALRITMAVAEALEAAHDHGIIHRDIKPGNILLTPDGSVRVVDFGISRAVSDVSRTVPGLLLGSIQYCSPEQVLGEAVGPSSDVYSLGIVLYELLTGARPFDGSSPVAVALERIRRQPRPPGEVVGDLPAGIDELVMRAVARDPGERYPSGRAFAEAIREWWRASRREAAAVSAVPRSERRRAVLTSAMGVAAASTVASGFGPGGGLRSAAARTSAGPRTAILGTARSPLVVPRDESDDHRILGLLIPLGALLLVALALWSVFRYDGSPANVLIATASPAATVAAVVATPRPSPSPLATPAPTPTPLAIPTPSPTPRAAPTPVPVVRATPRPTPRATPRATPRSTPRPTPRPVVTQSAPARTPTQTVARFYQLISAHEFSAAAQLWSARMRAEYPPSRYINSRFAHTTNIVLNRNQQMSMNLAAGTAVVFVDLTEYRDSSPYSRRWLGRWDLVLGRNGWLLDEPHF
jgi:eukaryotic-like serine/threonine-protein kinase